MQSINLEIKDSKAGAIEPGEHRNISFEQAEEFIFNSFQSNPERGGQIIIDIEEKGFASFIRNNNRFIFRSN